MDIFNVIGLLFAMSTAAGSSAWITKRRLALIQAPVERKLASTSQSAVENYIADIDLFAHQIMPVWVDA
jgi:hypothetical protein